MDEALARENRMLRVVVNSAIRECKIAAPGTAKHLEHLLEQAALADTYALAVEAMEAAKAKLEALNEEHCYAGAMLDTALAACKEKP